MKLLINSSVIKSAAYNETHGELLLTFPNGEQFVYDVTPGQFEDFCNADSAGAWFNRNLRGSGVHLSAPVLLPF